MKRKSISNNRSVETNSNKIFKIGVQPSHIHGVQTRKDKEFCKCPFALHRQQSENDKQNFDVAS